MSGGEKRHGSIGAHKKFPLNEWYGPADGLQFFRRPGAGPGGTDMVGMRNGLDPDTALTTVTGEMFDDMVEGAKRGDFDLDVMM